MDNNTHHLQLGENGVAEYTSSGIEESRVALFFALVRDLPPERLRQLLHDVVKDGKNNEEVIADLFIMAFQTRHCRGGKGEKDLFYHMIMELSLLYPETVSSLMKIVPYYGSFKDWFKIVEWSRDEKKVANHEVRRAMISVVDTIMNLACDQLMQDKESLDRAEQKKTLSLLAKWAPKEGHSMDGLAKELANKIFPESKSPKREYRQLLSRLNTDINTLEVKMSNNKWDKIDFSRDVPSVALMKYRKAFLNEIVQGQPPVGNDHETGNRKPHDTVRVTCRKRLRDTMMHKKVSKLKGRQLFPNEIIQKFLGHHQIMSTLEKDILSCQWNDIRTSVIKAMTTMEGKQQEGKKANLNKMVPLVDVSGSMYGTPMEVAISLGLLVSEITHPAYRNRCLTFSQTPTWIELHRSMSLDDKVQKVRNAPWGMNTDFEAATNKILQAAIKAKLEPEDIPDLIVFSDMQFDQARSSRHHNGKWETHYDRIAYRFKKEGLKVCGKAWPAPHIIYWNLRGDTSGFPAQADTPGVAMLSGYSPSLMKLFLEGEALEEDLEDIIMLDENGVVIKDTKNDPFATIRKALDSEDYDRVRECLYASQEGLLKNYTETQNREKLKIGDASKQIYVDDWEIIY